MRTRAVGGFRSPGSMLVGNQHPLDDIDAAGAPSFVARE
jgi:hypothetical protein